MPYFTAPPLESLVCCIPPTAPIAQAGLWLHSRSTSNRHLFSFLAVLGGVLISSPGASQETDPKPQVMELHLEAGEVTVSGATAGGRVAVIGVNRSHNGIIPVFRRESDVLVDEDQDGTVTWKVRGTPPRAVWAAVDLKTGAFVAATPSPDSVKDAPLPPDAVQRGDSGKVDEILHRGYHAEVFVVRAGDTSGGSWLLSASDGSTDDKDGEQDGKVELSLPSFQGIGESVEPPPEELAPGDVLLVVDRFTLEFSIAKLTA